MSDARYLALDCRDCGHWKKGQFTKAQIAEWLRHHTDPTMRVLEWVVECESTCPHPCGGVR